MSVKKEKQRKNAATLMIQGTASDVGKSIINTGLCRLLSRKGFKVSPFKSWNMSLNSTATPAGGEIGIAQSIQAQAAGISPTVYMQPLLVKPKGNGKSQIIVKGEPWGDFSYKDQNKNYIKKAEQVIQESLKILKKNFEIIIMEGAGSPVEVNRKNKDLANMKAASLHQTPVILTADIDRGGALASLVGTVRLLEPEERSLVQGFILNKFRGDFDLLKPGLEFLENYTDIPVLGVIPYFEEINIPEEDSASLKNSSEMKNAGVLTINIINLPHLSNFTDFKSLSQEPEVEVNYINEKEELNNSDLIIIPGTKNTTSDLEYIKKKGIAAKIKERYEADIPVIGICGGYQMMGQKLYDPENNESDLKVSKGLGILPVKTRFFSKKETNQVRGKIKNKGRLWEGLEEEAFTGYEIHMGETTFLKDKAPLFLIEKRSQNQVNIKDGIFDKKGFSFGTYIHGLFNNDNFRNVLLNNLRKKQGLPLWDRSQFNYQNKLENDLDKLADILEENIDMELLYSLLDI